MKNIKGKRNQIKRYGGGYSDTTREGKGSMAKTPKHSLLDKKILKKLQEVVA